MTPRSIPPDMYEGAPLGVVPTAITCEVTNGATATTPGIDAICLRSAAGFHT